MMRKLAMLASVVAAMAFARPALAQGPFADVPTDHWAYDSVNELAKQGIVNGYPDQTFGGKRALTRYEFAMAIQRMLQEVQRRIDAAVAPLKAPGGAQDLSGYVKKETCASDARVSYAKLTGAGKAKLRAAGVTHLRGIEELFVGRYSGSELATLADLLSRLPMTGSEASACS